MRRKVVENVLRRLIAHLDSNLDARLTSDPVTGEDRYPAIVEEFFGRIVDDDVVQPPDANPEPPELDPEVKSKLEQGPGSGRWGVL